MAWLVLLATDTTGRTQDTGPSDPEKPTVRLVEDPKPDRLLEVTARLDVRGRILAPVGVDRVVPLPLQASAQLSWQTRRLPAGGEFHRSLRTLRSYASAVSKVRVDRRTTESSLRASRRTIVAEGTPSGFRHYSLEGSLTGDEVELLELPADPLGLIGTLPLGQVPHDHAWTPGRWTLPLLTGLDAVTRGSLKGRVVKVTATTADVLLEGTAEGAAGGARSQVTFSGSLVFDHQHGYLKQARITIEEHRRAGPISPGLEIVAQVRIERKPATGKARLDRAVLATCPKQPTPDRLQLLLTTPGNGRLLYDRNWHVFHQTPDVSILRRLENGRLVAQCNLSTAPEVAAGSGTGREAFLRDVKTALGPRLREVVSIDPLKSRPGRRLQRGWRVTATGIDHGLPMHWFYYLCTHPSGRQLSLVFAVESDRLKTWARRDRDIISRLEISTNRPRTAGR
jgi:hypothetical protein